jgi:rhomboid family GlyGly-CTERM serine protease
MVFLRENIQQGELWRIWTGNLVHSNLYHLALNLTGFWLFVFIFKELMNTTQLLISLVFLISGVGLGLYFFNPQLYWYAGLSGALYGLFIVGAIYAFIGKDTLTALLILIVIPAKIIWDHLHNAGQTNAHLIGVPVSTDSHIYGISSACIISIVILIQHRAQIIKQPLQK